VFALLHFNNARYGIQTAVINNINVEKYFNYVFENINKEPIKNLLPYSKNIIEKLR
jgi:hypothetical protein